MSKFLIPLFSLAFHFGHSFQALSFLNSFHFFLHFHLVPTSLFFFFLSSDPLFWFFLLFSTVITRKLWNRKTILKAHIKFIWCCYKAIVSQELINSITNWNWSALRCTILLCFMFIWPFKVILRAKKSSSYSRAL